MLKRIIATFFLFIFLFNTVGYCFVFKIEQQQIRNKVKLKIKKSIPQSELITLEFNPSSEEIKEIQWIKDNEFKYRNSMYDIVSQLTDKNGTIFYSCINDVQEAKLFANLDEHIKKVINDKNNNKDGSEKDQLKKMMNDHFLQETSFSCFRILVEKPHIVEPVVIYKLLGSVPTPPPRREIVNM